MRNGETRVPTQRVCKALALLRGWECLINVKANTLLSKGAPSQSSNAWSYSIPWHPGRSP
jgi:hypothetical protein